jgi:hypothetical protein
VSRIDTWDENERALYALGSRALFDDLDRARESMTADLDRYRDDFTTRQAEQLRARQDRVRKLEADQAAWLADFIRGETDAPAQDPTTRRWVHLLMPGRPHLPCPASVRLVLGNPSPHKTSRPCPWTSTPRSGPGSAWATRAAGGCSAKGDMRSEFDQPEVPVSDYGRQRRAAWLAGLQANADMARSAAMAAHGQSEDRRVTQAGQAGIFGHMTPTDKGQAVAARQAVVGSDYDSRPSRGLAVPSSIATWGAGQRPHVWT